MLLYFPYHSFYRPLLFCFSSWRRLYLSISCTAAFCVLLQVDPCVVAYGPSPGTEGLQRKSGLLAAAFAAVIKPSPSCDAARPRLHSITYTPSVCGLQLHIRSINTMQADQCSVEDLLLQAKFPIAGRHYPATYVVGALAGLPILSSGLCRYVWATSVSSTELS